VTELVSDWDFTWAAAAADEEARPLFVYNRG